MASKSKFNSAVDYYPPSLLRRHGISLCDINREHGSTTGLLHTADINWTPDFKEFKQRTDALLHTPREQTLPEGWPQKLLGPLAWRAIDLDPHDFMVQLDTNEVKEIETALSHFNGLNRDLDDVSRATFPLPSLGPRLRDLCSKVYDGRGFCVLRGLYPDKYSREDNVAIYLGVSSYFGETRGRQYQDGRMMAHIADVKFDGVPDSSRRPLFTNSAQPFHSDLLCGVLAMYFLDMADQGGDVLLASSWNVYNELSALRPDIIHTLSKDDWVHDTFGRNPSYITRPLLHKSPANGRISLVFSRRNLTGSPATPRGVTLPPLTEPQAEALDAVHFTAAAHSVRIRPQPGDMFFVNNLAVLHSRAGFLNSDVGGGGHRRYALRLWLDDREKGWDVPPSLALAWDRIFAMVDEVENYWDIDPYVERGRQLFNKEGNGRDPLGGTRSSSCG